MKRREEVLNLTYIMYHGVKGLSSKKVKFFGFFS